MAVTGVLKKCADCGTVFVAENPASKYCPCCSARRNIPGPARGNGYRKPPPDALTLDVRAADAAGLSYGVWRAREDDRKRKAKEAIHRKIEERKKKHVRLSPGCCRGGGPGLLCAVQPWQSIRAGRYSSGSPKTSMYSSAVAFCSIHSRACCSVIGVISQPPHHSF